MAGLWQICCLSGEISSLEGPRGVPENLCGSRADGGGILPLSLSCDGPHGLSGPLRICRAYNDHDDGMARPDGGTAMPCGDGGSTFPAAALAMIPGLEL